MRLGACAVLVISACGSEPEATVPKVTHGPPQLSTRIAKSGKPFYVIDPREMQANRVAGELTIVPDDSDRIHLKERLVASVRLCVDETGHYESGEFIQESGLRRYDAKIARALMHWELKPYVYDGAPVPVCSAVTFVYSQR